MARSARAQTFLWCVLPALALVAVTTVLNLMGQVGSKYTGALWAFLPMVAFAKSQLSGWRISAIFCAALALQGALHWVVPADALVLPATPPWVGPFVWTFMLGAALLVGLILGAKSRRAATPRSAP